MQNQFIIIIILKLGPKLKYWQVKQSNCTILMGSSHLTTKNILGD
jgi:hypothetical protein